VINYSDWKDVPANLKTKTALKQMGLKLKRGQQPVAIKTHWDHKIPDYKLYEVSEAVPNVVSDKQRAAIEKAKQASLEKRTCTRCGWVEDLSKHYRNKPYINGGLCPNCLEEDRIASDRTEAVEWARQILTREDVLILDTETTDLHGEIIELAMINLKGEAIYNRRFNPLSPVSYQATAVHGITNEMLENEPAFIDEYATIYKHLTDAGLVLIYNAVFDTARIKTTCIRHGVTVPEYKTECIMELYAQFCGEWSDHYGSYRWHPLNGGHDALGDCRAALGVLQDMAGDKRDE